MTDLFKAFITSTELDWTELVESGFEQQNNIKQDRQTLPIDTQICGVIRGAG